MSANALSKELLLHCCKLMTDMIGDKRFPVEYGPRFREYAISEVKNGKRGIVHQGLFHCPWCGQKLPESLRNEWFDIIEAMGLDDIDTFSDIEDDPRIPEDMKSDAWWRKQPTQ